MILALPNPLLRSKVRECVTGLSKNGFKGWSTQMETTKESIHTKPRHVSPQRRRVRAKPFDESQHFWYSRLQKLQTGLERYPNISRTPPTCGVHSINRWSTVRRAVLNSYYI